jgi:hypothetical protein
MPDWTDYEIFVPVDANHHRAVMLAVKFTQGSDALLWRARYRTYIRPIYYGLLNRAQDQWMISHMQTPPERLYRPDVSITAWRRWCQDQARDAAPPAAATAPPPAESLVGSSVSSPRPVG